MNTKEVIEKIKNQIRELQKIVDDLEKEDSGTDHQNPKPPIETFTPIMISPQHDNERE